MAVPYFEKLNEKIITLGLESSGNIFLECKQFLSGAALYANGQICATLSPAGFVLKLPEPVRQQIKNLNIEESRPEDRPMLASKDYVTLPALIVRDNQLLKSLIELSIHSANLETLHS